MKVLFGGVAAACALGGVAFAAQTGTLPHPFHPGTSSERPASATASASITPGTATRPAPPSTPGPSPARPSAHTATGSPWHVPAPNTRHLCESYADAVGKGRSLDAASRTRLEQAAGGKSKIARYCVHLTGASPTARPRPSSPPHPTRQAASPPAHAG